ncbi:MAG: hypothetical protein QOE36_398, partial [Gaiellaceae bacterium]|nr:hypothetical protein [Gaiellaceae bacterium]
MVGALVAVSTGLRLWAGLRIPVPWIAPDEVIYGELGRNLYEHGRLGILGHATSFYSLVYPALIGLPLAVGDPERGYDIAKALQAVVMSLAAVPVYYWGRSFLPRGWALAAAALSLTLPGLVYSGLLMTEVAFYPVVVLAAWASARALLEPTRRNQLLLLGALALAVLTRLQAVVLVLAFVTAVVLFALSERRRPDFRRYATLGAGLAALAVVWVAVQFRHGGSASTVLGGYRGAAGSYGVWKAIQYVFWHFADLLLITGFVPVCALVVLLVAALRGRETDRPTRAFLAVAASFVGWLVLEVAIFASRHVGWLAERNLFALGPILFLALAAWASRGASRPRWTTASVCVAALALVLSLPLDTFVADETLPDNFTLIPLYLHTGSGSRAVVLLLLALLGLALFALLPRRVLWVLPVLLGVAFSAASVSASRLVVDRARVQQTKLVGPVKTWIDRSADAPVAFLYDGSPYWNEVWETVFWNRRIDRVYDLPGPSVPGPLPQEVVKPTADGRFGPDPALKYVVSSSWLTFRGRRVAEAPQAEIPQAGLVLWQLRPPARLATSKTGLLPNGDMYAPGHGRLVVYGCGSGTFHLTLLAKQPQQVRVLLNFQLAQQRTFPKPDTWDLEIPSNPVGEVGKSTCTVD